MSNCPQPSPPVAVIIVTFNRLELLKKTLGGVMAQNAPITDLIIVDNASTEPVSVWFQTLRQPEPGGKPSPRLHYIRNSRNLGGAGGFAAGMEKAFSLSVEWFWLMDDDVEPRPNALSELISHSDEALCMQPGRIFEDGTWYDWSGEFNPSTLKVASNLPPGELPELLRVTTGCFEGMLIHRSIVEKIGLPDARFFIWGDDSIYGYLASRYTPVLLVNKPLLVRLIKKETTRMGTKTLIPATPLHAYLCTRNQFLLRENLKSIGMSNAKNWLSAIIYGVKSLCVYALIYRNPKLALFSLKGLWHGVIRKFNNHLSTLNI